MIKKVDPEAQTGEIASKINEIIDFLNQKDEPKISAKTDLSADNCPYCRCLYDDKATSPAQGRDGSCKCHCGHKSPDWKGYHGS